MRRSSSTGPGGAVPQNLAAAASIREGASIAHRTRCDEPPDQIMELTLAAFLASGDPVRTPGASSSAFPAGEPNFVERQHRSWLVPGFKRRFEPRWHDAAFGGALVLLIGVGLLAGGIAAWRASALEDALYRTDGVDTDCAVISRRIVSDRRGQSWAVRCAYAVASDLLAASFSVSELHYRDLALGVTIPVRYLRADPTRIRMRGPTNDPVGLPLIGGLFGVGAMMGGAALLEEGVKRRRVEKRLEREGVLLPGRVVYCCVGRYQPKHGPTCYTMSITYRFTCPCGAEIVGHENLGRLVEFEKLPEDAPVCVAFAAPRCFRVL